MPYVKSVPVSHCQFGYRENTSTILANVLLKEALASNMQTNGSVYTCFLDLSKAFDRLNIDKLINKLNSSNLPDYIVNIVEFSLKNSSARVCYGGAFSDRWSMVKGVRQGGVTSAYLFNIYINEILDKVSRLQPGCYLGIKKMNVQAYADDMVVLCNSAKGLQILAENLYDLMLQHDLVVNRDERMRMRILFKNHYKGYTYL